MIPLRDTQPSHSKPIVVVLLILLNAMLFLFEVILPPEGLRALFSSWAIIPDRFQVHTLFTSMFLHGGWLHVIGNMWFLWIFGDNVEDVLGHGRFLLFYVGTGIAAGLVHVAFNANSPVPTIGASGAIAGVMGAYLVKFPHSRILTLVPIVVFLTTIEVPAVLMLLYWFAIQLFSGTLSAGESAVSGGTAWFAHVGGFVAGAAVMRILPTRRPPPVILPSEDF